MDECEVVGIVFTAFCSGNDVIDLALLVVTIERFQADVATPPLNLGLAWPTFYPTLGSSTTCDPSTVSKFLRKMTRCYSADSPRHPRRYLLICGLLVRFQRGSPFFLSTFSDQASRRSSG